MSSIHKQKQPTTMAIGQEHKGEFFGKDSSERKFKERNFLKSSQSFAVELSALYMFTLSSKERISIETGKKLVCHL